MDNHLRGFEESRREFNRYLINMKETTRKTGKIVQSTRTTTEPAKEIRFYAIYQVSCSSE